VANNTRSKRTGFTVLDSFWPSPIFQTCIKAAVIPFRWVGFVGFRQKRLILKLCMVGIFIDRCIGLREGSGHTAKPPVEKNIRFITFRIHAKMF